MTIPSERWQAVKYAEALLAALAHYEPITDDMRNRARYILRHYPTACEADMAEKREEAEMRKGKP